MSFQQEHRSVEERREQLVSAAIAVLRAGGISSVTTRAVTARARVPHGAFHYCFASKASLFRAVLERQLRTALAAAFEAPSGQIDLQDRIAAGLSAHLAQIRADPATALAVVELVTFSRRDPDLQDLAVWEQHAYLEAVHEQIDKWIAEDAIRWAV